MDEFNGKLIFESDFNDKIDAIKKNNFKLSENPTKIDWNDNPQEYPEGESVLNKIEDIEKDHLDVKNGEKISFNKKTIAGYDESFEVLRTLEGLPNLTVHSLIIIKNNYYKPIAYVTFNFYTRSKKYAEENKRFKYSENPEKDIKRDYVASTKYFLSKYVKEDPDENPILFIDGPLIGGNLSYDTRKMNDELLNKNIIPIFFVKNSNSNLVVDHYEELKGKFNSDLDWAQKTLKMGERSSFFKYVDKNNKNFGKVFCYLKTTPLTVQRVEFDVRTYDHYKDSIKDIMDMIYYFIYLQGSYENPQVRPIAIAEMYAREILKKVKTIKFKELGITPTMNEIRFGRENYEMDCFE